MLCPQGKCVDMQDYVCARDWLKQRRLWCQHIIYVWQSATNHKLTEKSWLRPDRLLILKLCDRYGLCSRVIRMDRSSPESLTLRSHNLNAHWDESGAPDFGKEGWRERKKKKRWRGVRENQSQLLHSLISLYAHLAVIPGSDLGRVSLHNSLWSCFFIVQTNLRRRHHFAKEFECTYWILQPLTEEAAKKKKNE